MGQQMTLALLYEIHFLTILTNIIKIVLSIKMVG